MKSSAGTQELQATFRLIGQALLQAESQFFWFGYPGKTAGYSGEHACVNDFLKQQLIGIRTGDLELYLEDLKRSLAEAQAVELEKSLGIQLKRDELSAALRLLRCCASEARRRKMFADCLEREIRRRLGETDDGETPVPTGVPLRVSS